MPVAVAVSLCGLARRIYRIAEAWGLRRRNGSTKPLVRLLLLLPHPCALDPCPALEIQGPSVIKIRRRIDKFISAAGDTRRVHTSASCPSFVVGLSSTACGEKIPSSVECELCPPCESEKRERATYCAEHTLRCDLLQSVGVNDPACKPSTSIETGRLGRCRHSCNGQQQLSPRLIRAFCNVVR